MVNTKLWTRAFEALEQLHEFEGGNAVIRVLARFFSEIKDFRFHFKKNRRAFILIAVESGWYADIIDALDDVTHGGRISLDQAKSLVECIDANPEHADAIHKALKTIGIAVQDFSAEKQTPEE